MNKDSEMLGQKNLKTVSILQCFTIKKIVMNQPF